MDCLPEFVATRKQVLQICKGRCDAPVSMLMAWLVCKQCLATGGAGAHNQENEGQDQEN